jgi:X-X-X-Leu-X-X-Gly heptad repeat protein
MIRLMAATICLLAFASVGAAAQVQSGVQPLQSGVVPLQSGVAGASQQQQETPRAPTTFQPPVRMGESERRPSSPRGTISAPDAHTNQVR